MKIRVTTQGKSMVVDLEEKLAGKLFSAIVLQLLKADGILAPQKENETKKEVPEPAIVETAVAERPYKKLEGLHSYKGFLYMKCSACGTVKGFCAKEPMEGYHCFECGADTSFLDELVPLHVNCQCGKHFTYMTNITDAMFDINCIDCGAPAAVSYNAKKKLYETIREES